MGCLAGPFQTIISNNCVFIMPPKGHWNKSSWRTTGSPTIMYWWSNFHL